MLRRDAGRPRPLAARGRARHGFGLPGEPDAALLARARAEGRVLVTRDGALASADAAVLRVPATLDDQAAMLARAMDLDWLAAPFTRCLVDNMVLRDATEAEQAGAPARARDLSGPFRACPACSRLYWPGSHVRRMAARLERWAGVA